MWKGYKRIWEKVKKKTNSRRKEENRGKMPS